MELETLRRIRAKEFGTVPAGFFFFGSSGWILFTVDLVLFLIQVMIHLLKKIQIVKMKNFKNGNYQIIVMESLTVGPFPTFTKGSYSHFCGPDFLVGPQNHALVVEKTGLHGKPERVGTLISACSLPAHLQTKQKTAPPVKFWTVSDFFSPLAPKFKRQKQYFACQKSPEQMAQKESLNAHLTGPLSILEKNSTARGDKWRSFAYAKAVRILKSLSYKVSDSSSFSLSGPDKSNIPLPHLHAAVSSTRSGLI